MKCAEPLTQTFRLVFANPTLTISAEMAPNDIDGWDSMAHVNLMAAVESRFKIRFSQKELVTIETVGDLARLIDKKLA